MDSPRVTDKERQRKHGIAAAKAHQLLLVRTLTSRPKVTQALATALATVTFALWLVSFVATCWFISFVWPAPFGLFLGLILLLIVALSLPRPPGIPKNGVRIERLDAPQLFGLLDQLCELGGINKIDILMFDDSINAQTVRVGLRRRLVIVVGMPLWEALDHRERVALLAHEVAHDANGDLWRNSYVGTSIHVLNKWSNATDPGPLEDASDLGVVSLFAWFLLVLPHLFSQLLCRAQTSLTLAAHQKAEFAADALAAQLASTQAVVDLLERLILSGTISFGIKSAKKAQTNVWESIRERSESLPPGDRALLRATAMEEQSRVDATHPPTGQRLQALASSVPASGQVSLDWGRNRRIDEELRTARVQIEAKLLATDQR